MSQDITNQNNPEPQSQTTGQPSFGQFPQDQNQYTPGKILPQDIPEMQGQNPDGQLGLRYAQPPQQQYQQPGYGQQNTQNQYQQPGYPQQQYDPNAAQYGQQQQYAQQNPYQQQSPYQQQQQQQQYPAGQYDQNAYQQNPYGQQQQQYQTGYEQNTYQSATTQPYGNDPYLNYDQKAGRTVGLVIGGIVFVLALVGIGMGFKMTHPPAVLAPTAFNQFEVGDGSFSIAQPVGWQTDSGGTNGVESNATFRSGKAKVYADSTLSGSLQGDIINANNVQRAQIGDQIGKPVVITPPVVQLHRQGEAAVQDNYANYNEQPMQSFTCGLGSGWYSEFTGNAGTVTGNVHGYRATVLSSDRMFTIVTVCRESDWPALQATFMKELTSLDRGKMS